MTNIDPYTLHVRPPRDERRANTLATPRRLRLKRQAKRHATAKAQRQVRLREAEVDRRLAAKVVAGRNR